MLLDAIGPGHIGGSVGARADRVVARVRAIDDNVLVFSHGHFLRLLAARWPDAEREWGYDRTSHIGRLDKALDEAQAKRWTIVNMQQDWKTIFPSAAGR
jgi:Histidine phosphatase superfamily (branch 1)